MKNNFFTWMCILLTMVVKAQNAADIDPTFKIGKSFTKCGNIRGIAVQTDGKIIVCGEFNLYNGIKAQNIIRLNTDGTTDTTFKTGTGFDNFENAIALQPDGKIIVGGNFTSYNGTAAKGLIRLNKDGTVDSTLNPGTGIEGEVESIAVQQDGKLLIGGFIYSYNGIPAQYFLRLNPDGTTDTTFNMGTGFGNAVDAIFIQTDGKILVGGLFDSYNGNEAHSIIRLNTNGSVDTTFNSGTGFDYYSVYSIAVQSDGKIIAGGWFNGYNGTVANNIARLNADGTIDTTFNTGTGFNSPVAVVAVQSDGKIIAGGGFNIFNGASSSGAIRLNSNGTADTSFVVGSGFNRAISSIAIQSNGKILFGGASTFYNNLNISGLTRIGSNGTKDATYNTAGSLFEILNQGQGPQKMVKQADEKIIVCGDFDYYFGSPSHSIVRLNTDGTKDKTFSFEIGNFDNVSSIAIQTDGKILVGGILGKYFTGNANNYIIRLNTDLSIDNTFNSGIGFNGGLVAIAVTPGGKIIVVGFFDSYNGTSSPDIIRLNSDGTADSSFNVGTGIYNPISSVAVQPDGKIIVVGSFLSYNGATAVGIIRINTNGTKDTTFVDDGFRSGTHPPEIGTIYIQPDGKILVANGFDHYYDKAAPGLIRLNKDGSADAGFNLDPGFTGGATAIAVQSDGKILISPNFGTTKKIMRLNTDGSTDSSFDSGVGTDNFVNAILLQTDGKIILGGGFTSYNGTSSVGIVRLKGDSFLSTENFAQAKMSLYPNPAINRINMQIPTDLQIDKIIITDLSGKTLLKQTQFKEINIENLSSGIYIIQAYSGQNKWQSKFIKE